MIKRQVLVYYAWSRPGENGAPLHVIEDRFPTLFESRRMVFPRFHELSNPSQFEQSVAGFLDHIMKRNFTAFVDLAATLTGQSVTEIERVADDGLLTPLDAHLLRGVDTLIVISFDSLRTAQDAESEEIEALKTFLEQPDHLAFICPHHDIGDVTDLPESEQLPRQIAEFQHHGDTTIPPRQRFGGFARSLLAGLGVPVENRFGLRPAAEADGSPAPIEAETSLDRLGLLHKVSTFNRHPHLPQLERLGDAVRKLDVLARQRVDPTAPPHPFTLDRATFDALLQSRPDTFIGSLLVSDTTLWSSTAGGVDSLRELWTNVVQRPLRS
ncbi:hypothetical protein BCh11DRAFT_02720 [Burkholderia sp. Ch1-1]|uniref:Uncharacterized protein n=1 Tax=Paraburkholderia dioscoreae TaxID=2604047 RepID=A0A5Q4ZRX2_9BURK|nr:MULTISPECIES: hypothetical protein [Paraburkholderia]EIF34911.1 hypothetical protein BCh11DRAFT_02720 [Burkholderia sp. Ch1-1]MDR8396528.1 hypothetical protein [Paraburkholderia sp. USG1]VVD34090.1 conserved protein of unknown function [Paraburkholderia dioscoreae]